MHACTHTLHSVLPLWSTFHCHCVQMTCIATCVEVYCCVVMVLSLKCSSSPGRHNATVDCLPECSCSSSWTSDCSKGRCQHSRWGGLFIYCIIQIIHCHGNHSHAGHVEAFWLQYLSLAVATLVLLLTKLMLGSWDMEASSPGLLTPTLIFVHL